MKTDFERFRLNNLDCADCAARLESGLKQMKGVNFASVNFATATLVIDAKDHAAVFDFIRREEPEVEVEALGEGKGREREIPWKQIGILSASLILFVFGMTQVSKWHGGDGEIWEWLVFGAAYLLSGWRVLASAVRRLANRNWFDESFLMSIATLGAIAIHELPEAVGVMLFYKAGEVIQEFSLEGARDSIRALMSVKAVTAQVVENGKTRPTAPEDVDVGAKIMVPPGEKVPLDGVVLEGRSEINQAALTGESLPAAVEPGDEVYAGVVNLYSQLTVEVTKRYEDSAAARLLALVEEAGNRKAKTEKFITRFANYYTPIIVGLAGLLAFVPPLVVPGATLAEWAYRALVLLVIACPCALMISIPLGYFGGVGGASRRGILVKGANYLDVLAQVRTVVFDKTGTLTRGRFAVIEVVPQNGYAPEELLRIANEVERASNHPIAASIRLANHHAGEVKAARDFEELPGLGVRAEFDGYTAIAGNDEMMHRYAIEHEICEPGGTAVHVAVDDRYAGFVRLADEVKADSQEGIAALHKLGVEKVMMLTGDRETIAADIAAKIGVDEYHAELMPEDKVEILEDLLAEEGRGKVAYVGDGINDAPVLRRADVGLAIGDLGSQAAIETADVVLMTGAPTKVAEAIRHAKRTRGIVWQNIGLALGVKLVFVALGASAAVGMWEAVFADVGVTLLAILNATRVLR